MLLHLESLVGPSKEFQKKQNNVGEAEILERKTTIKTQQWELIALNRQGTLQQRPVSSMVTPPGM